jgi:hypothetical protein
MQDAMMARFAVWTTTLTSMQHSVLVELTASSVRAVRTRAKRERLNVYCVSRWQLWRSMGLNDFCVVSMSSVFPSLSDVMSDNTYYVQ